MHTPKRVRATVSVQEEKTITQCFESKYCDQLCLHREHEINKIKEFLQDRDSRAFNILMLTGPPGSGKTMSCSHAIADIKNYQSHNILQFNAVVFLKFNIFLRNLLSKLSGNLTKRGSQELMLRKIKKSLDNDQKGWIIVVDEIDSLFKENSELTIKFMQVFREGTSLLIGISNQIDFIDRAQSKQKVKLPIQNIIFKPYDRHQIKDILTRRIHLNNQSSSKKINIKDEALRFISAKSVSNMGGDMRHVLQICKQSIKIACCEQGSSVGISHIDSIIEQKDGSNRKSEVIKDLPKQQQLVLCTLNSLLKKQKAINIQLDIFLKRVNYIRKQFSSEPFSKTYLLDILTQLRTYGLVKGPEGKNQLISSRTQIQDLERVFQDNSMKLYL